MPSAVAVSIPETIEVEAKPDKVPSTRMVVVSVTVTITAPLSVAVSPAVTSSVVASLLAVADVVKQSVMTVAV